MAKQLRVVEAGKVEVEEAAELSPASGEVIVEVRRCGVCGSDLHWFKGHGPLPPVCPGHEISGIVSSVGRDVATIREGDRVAVEPLVRCGSCEPCRRGDYHLCAMLNLHGITLPGGMASSISAPAYCLFPLPEGIDFELGALTEPLAVTVHAARLGGVGPGSRVLILGAGTVGLLTACAARHLGAEFVAITARHPQQKAMAESLGCNQVLDPGDFHQVQCEPSVVIETVGGNAPTLGDAMMAVQKGGNIVVVGLFEQSPEINPMLLILKELRISGSMVYNRSGGVADFHTALDILSARADDLTGLISHRFPLEQAQAAFDTAADKHSGAVKVLISPNEN